MAAAPPPGVTGYSGKALPAKLGLKPGHRLLLVDPPAHVDALLDGAPPDLVRLQRLASFDVGWVFVTRADALAPALQRLLPKLADGPLEEYPRVFGLAWAYVAHTDSRFDPQTLGRFVRAYQRVQPLTIGELWAVAITLRIVLV